MKSLMASDRLLLDRSGYFYNKMAYELCLYEQASYSLLVFGLLALGRTGHLHFSKWFLHHGQAMYKVIWTYVNWS